MKMEGCLIFKFLSKLSYDSKFNAHTDILPFRYPNPIPWVTDSPGVTSTCSIYTTDSEITLFLHLWEKELSLYCKKFGIDNYDVYEHGRKDIGVFKNLFPISIEIHKDSIMRNKSHAKAIFIYEDTYPEFYVIIHKVKANLAFRTISKI